VGAEVTSGWAPDPAGQSPHGQAPGSPDSDAAVGFAFEEAANWRADLHAVRAWNDEVVDTTIGDHRRFTDPSHTEETERALLSKRLAGWSSRYPDVVVRQTVVRGRSAPASLEFVEWRSSLQSAAAAADSAPDCWGPPATR
jgi:hypothetical protein